MWLVPKNEPSHLWTYGDGVLRHITSPSCQLVGDCGKSTCRAVISTFDVYLCGFCPFITEKKIFNWLKLKRFTNEGDSNGEE